MEVTVESFRQQAVELESMVFDRKSKNVLFGLFQLFFEMKFIKDPLYLRRDGEGAESEKTARKPDIQFEDSRTMSRTDFRKQTSL